MPQLYESSPVASDSPGAASPAGFVSLPLKHEGGRQAHRLHHAGARLHVTTTVVDVRPAESYAGTHVAGEEAKGNDAEALSAGVVSRQVARLADLNLMLKVCTRARGLSRFAT